MITEFIPIGHNNAIKRHDLMMLTGLTDRQLRREIMEARRETVILNMQDGKGYFIPAEDEMELSKEWLLQEENRIKRHAVSLYAVRKAVKDA